MTGRLVATAAMIALTGCATERVSIAPPAVPPATMQYLYGSGEAAAASIQAFTTLVASAGRKRHLSVVLASGATLDAPRFSDCGDKPLAAVFDMDETLALNLGYEFNDARTGAAFAKDRWARWEKSGAAATAPVPGAVAALAELRRLGVTPVINSNRNATAAHETEIALEAAGLGAFRHGETLFLKGDADGGSGKDGRRAEIAKRFCVIAMAGDQLGDFSDQFVGDPQARRAIAQAPDIAKLWGNGWFVLPNPVYGSGVTGSFDQVFPTDKRWADPAGKGDK